MPRKPKLTNVRNHLQHIQKLIEFYQQHGDCPLFQDELANVSFINRAILRKNDAKRAKGNRHDIYVGISNDDGMAPLRQERTEHGMT